jgi:ribonuclease J
MPTPNSNYRRPTAASPKPSGQSRPAGRPHPSANSRSAGAARPQAGAAGRSRVGGHAGRGRPSRQRPSGMNQPRGEVLGPPTPDNCPLRVISLGGVGNMGKNLTVIEYGKDMICIDCGSTFPDDTMLGIDLVLPDVSYLERNRHKLRAFVITHGHEDHIGSIPYIAPKFAQAPIWAPPLAAALIQVKLEEYPEAQGVKILTYKSEDKIRLGVFTVSFCRVNHSIPDCFAIVVETPEGVIFHTGDFKFDATPPDGIQADYAKMEAVGDAKPLLLLSESTNAHTPGRTDSEQVIADAFMKIFSETKGRLIVSSFASRIDRIQHVIAAAVKYKRKVAVAGRSMLKNLEVANRLGYINYPKDLLIQLHQVSKVPDSQVVVLATGSQGQEGSALQRMAFAEHREIRIKAGDTVLLSSSAIPGNERSVNAMINNLCREGANVLFDKKMQVHVSGHGYQEEMLQMLELIRPQYFTPIHGDYHMLVAHTELAEKSGVAKSNINIIEDGDVLEVVGGKVKKTAEKVFVGSVMVDGLGVGDVKEIVLRDRQTMAKEGVVMVVVTVDRRGRLVSSPDIISRGFVYMREKTELINKTRDGVKKTLAKHLTSVVPDDWSNIKGKIRDNVSEYLYKETERRPLVLPVIITV